MLQEVRKLEKELKLEPIHMDVFGNDAVERARTIGYYLLDLIATAKQYNVNNKGKENEHG